jgi:hypothetical protein
MKKVPIPRFLRLLAPRNRWRPQTSGPLSEGSETWHVTITSHNEQQLKTTWQRRNFTPPPREGTTQAIRMWTRLRKKDRVTGAVQFNPRVEPQIGCVKIGLRTWSFYCKASSDVGRSHRTPPPHPSPRPSLVQPIKRLGLDQAWTTENTWAKVQTVDVLRTAVSQFL